MPPLHLPEQETDPFRVHPLALYSLLDLPLQCYLGYHHEDPRDPVTEVLKHAHEEGVLFIHPLKVFLYLFNIVLDDNIEQPLLFVLEKILDCIALRTKKPLCILQYSRYVPPAETGEHLFFYIFVFPVIRVIRNSAIIIIRSELKGSKYKGLCLFRYQGSNSQPADRNLCILVPQFLIIFRLHPVTVDLCVFRILFKKGAYGHMHCRPLQIRP
ncbi:hypothetical protein BMS3Bbin07_00097 [bacterium BMS3Bbin07]|nr:hypothetical protein BMS3Bbin07_00097 [bacterium BMS3Bbin07]